MSDDHILRRFDDELTNLRRDLLAVGESVRGQLAAALAPILNDAENASAKIERAGHAVNLAEKRIDRRCIEIIATHQPTARDLRALAAAMKNVTDMERIGDEAEKIARHLSHPGALEQMTRNGGAEKASAYARAVLANVDAAFAALRDSDAAAAVEVVRRDDDINEMFRDILVGRVVHARDESAEAAVLTAALFAIKAMERVGDHAKNIAEFVVYVESGHDIRHGGLEGFAKNNGK